MFPQYAVINVSPQWKEAYAANVHKCRYGLKCINTGVHAYQWHYLGEEKMYDIAMAKFTKVRGQNIETYDEAIHAFAYQCVM